MTASNNCGILKGRLGVYPAGALSAAFFIRLKAELMIGRASGPTTAWLNRRRCLQLDGDRLDLCGRWKRGLASPGLLPELIIVSPYAGALPLFLGELLALFRRLERAGFREPEALPFFLLASSGLYYTDFMEKAACAVRASGLKNKESFLSILDRRLFRASAYQAAVRLGAGPEAAYFSGREKSALVVSRGGLAADRRRIASLLGGRGYKVSFERRPGEGEFDKALVNLASSAMAVLCARAGVTPRRLRFGDVIAPAARPKGFTAMSLPGFAVMQERRLRLARALVRVGRACGAYTPGVSAEAKLRAADRYIGREAATHYPSSVQSLFASVKSGLPVEDHVAGPLLEMARRQGLAGPARELAALRADLVSAAKVVRRRVKPSLRLLRLARRLELARALKRAPCLLAAIDGLPGSGKTTLAEELAATLRALGYSAARVCLDDFYYEAARRKKLGLKRWGPGTHDLSFVPRLAALKAGESAELPVFDKRLRDRAPGARRLEGPLDFILLEGFGVSLQDKGYSVVSGLADFFILLDAPLSACRAWRFRAGLADRASAAGAAGFREEFNRMWPEIIGQSRRVLAAARPRADLVLKLGRGHRVLACREAR